MIGCGIGGIEIFGQGEPGATGHLHQIKHHRAMAGRCHGRQLAQMLGAARGDAIGKFGEPRPAAQMHILDLDIGIRQIIGPEQEIYAGIDPVFLFRPDIAIGCKRPDRPRAQRCADDPVRQAGIDPGPHPAGQVDQDPGPFQFALRIGGRLHPDRHSGLCQAQHRPGIGAMGRDLGAIRQNHIRKKTLIPPDQARRLQRGFKTDHPPRIGRRNRKDKQMGNPTAAMLVIGDEILSGRTRDINAHVLAQALTAHGITLVEIRFVADDPDQIIAALNSLRASMDHVFTSGGIGPTHDDITADCVARAFGVGIDIRDDARAILATNYANPETDLNPARLRMARIPDGASLIDNPVSKAPGFSLQNVHVMAGVPKIFEAMLAGLLPRLTGGTPLQSRSLRLDLPEGRVAGPLGEFAEQNPTLVIGCYPFNEGGNYGCNIVFRGPDPAALDDAVRAFGRLVA